MANHVGDDEERRAAEDYRRQRQRADARRHGYKPHAAEEFARWMDEHADFLAELVKANGASEHDAAALLDEYKKSLGEAPVGSEFDQKMPN
jgi:F0F1-type ATP synthase membrane subunit b/b'